MSTSCNISHCDNQDHSAVCKTTQFLVARNTGDECCSLLCVKSCTETKTLPNYWNKLKAFFGWTSCGINEIINCLEQERHQCLKLDENLIKSRTNSWNISSNKTSSMHHFLKFIFGIKLYMFRTVPLPIIRNISLCTQQWYMSYRLQLQLASRPVWHVLLLCVQWKIPDDRQRNCPKHVEFYSKNKFEKWVHLVDFIIRIYHDARSPECQKLKSSV